MKKTKEKGHVEVETLLKYANSIIATLREPFLVLNKRLQIISANHAFYATFEVGEKETIGRLLPDLGNRQWDIPNLLKLLKEVIPEKKVVQDYEVEHKFEQIGERTMVLNACQLRVPKQVAVIIAGEIEEEEEEEEELILLAIEDITERERLQKELKASEERYRRAFETSRDGLLLIHKIKGDILNSNESIQELLGHSEKEFLKKKLWEIGVTKDDLDFQKTVSRLEKDGIIHYEDIPVKTKKGPGINSEVFLVDKAKVIQCNVRDITTRKNAKKKLEKSEYEKTLILNNTSEIIAFHDTDHNLLWANKAYLKSLGKSLEDVKGKKCYHNWGLDRLCNDCPVAKAIETGEAQRRELTPENQPHWPAEQGSWSISATSAKDAAGNTIGAIEIAYDITERKKAEEKIKEALRKNKSLVGAVGQIIYEHYLPEDRIVWSGDYQKKLGFSEEEMGNSSKGWIEKAHPEDVDAVKNELKRATETGTSYNLIYRFRKKNREYLWLHDRGAFTKDPESGKVLIIGLMEDITERKKTEKELKEKIQDLERFSKFAVDRELKMEKLEKRIKELEGRE